MIILDYIVNSGIITWILKGGTQGRQPQKKKRDMIMEAEVEMIFSEIRQSSHKSRNTHFCKIHDKPSYDISCRG